MVVDWNKIEIKFVEGKGFVVNSEIVAGSEGVLVGKNFRFFDKKSNCEIDVSGSFDVYASGRREFFNECNPEDFKKLLYKEISGQIGKAGVEISKLKDYAFSGRVKEHEDGLVLSREINRRRNGSFDQRFYNIVSFRDLAAFECLLKGDISYYSVGTKVDRKNFSKLSEYVGTNVGDNLCGDLNLSYDAVLVEGNSLKKSLERTLKIYEFMK